MGPFKFSKEDTSKQTIDDVVGLNTSSLQKKSIDVDKGYKPFMYASSKSPNSIVNYASSSIERSIPFHFMDDRKKSKLSNIKNSVDLVRDDKQMLNSIDLGRFNL